ncbi:uncharacterized protein LOC134805455 [Cydia splendana]|uniref:uncharacterized protein LOC134805455 n=1 Tax=Cydia splendana TaxID=1100963 RepID=UPI00300C60D8
MLDKALEKTVPLHDAQFGFRSGLSTEAAVLCLKHTVRYYTDRRTPVYACFLDLSKAFDLVSYDLLWKKLSQAAVPGELVELFKFCLWINYTNKAYSALRVLYNNAFRMLMGLPRYCSASGMFAEAHTDDFRAI